MYSAFRLSAAAECCRSVWTASVLNDAQESGAFERISSMHEEGTGLLKVTGMIDRL